jgi:hypothetical protein
MNCNKAKKSGILFWERPEPEQKELQDHWQECPECRESFQALANSIELCRQNLQSEEKLEDFSHYWSRLPRRLVKPSWSESLAQWTRNAISLISRSIWGPVPAYAVVGMVIIAVFAILPISQNSISALRPASAFRSSLVVERFEPNGANSKDGLTVYTLAQNTAPTPAPTTSSRSTAR